MEKFDIKHVQLRHFDELRSLLKEGSNLGLDLSDVNSYVRSLESQFNENNYNSFTNNCQYFVKALIRKIS